MEKIRELANPSSLFYQSLKKISKDNFSEQFKNNEELKSSLSFDLTIDLDSGVSYKSTCNVDLPIGDIVKDGRTETEIKNLDKQMDRIKTAYIKGVLKLNDFDKEIKHIEYQRTELTNKLKEQKQYENLSFTVDDLLIIQDKQEIETYVKPEKFIENIYNWVNETREKRQKLIATYIDNIEIKKVNNKVEMVDGNFRSDYIRGMINNHNNYGLPYNINWFVDDYGCSLNMNKEHKTQKQALKYFNKLQETVGSDYKLNYYEVDTDDDLKDISFTSELEAEKIIRLICIKNDKNYKKQNLRLGVITIDLSDIKDKNGNSLYKEVLEKAKEVYKNELCNI